MRDTQPTRYRLLGWYVVSGICLLAWTMSTGCALRRSATFLPSEEVQQIRVSQNIAGRQVNDARVLNDPARVAQLHAFLEEHEDGWEPLWDTPWSGDYSILLESDDSYQSVFIVGNTMQTNSNGVPVERELSDESRQRLLALIGLNSDMPSENGPEATLASHTSSE